MHLFKSKFVQTFLVISIAYLGIVFLISQNPAGDREAIDKKLVSMSSDNRLELLVQITGVNPLEGTANARVLPWPNTPDVGYRLKSGWVPGQSVDIVVDSVIGASNGGSNIYSFEQGQPTGGFDVQIDEQPGAGRQSNISWYPLDKYNFEIPISAVSTLKNGDQVTLNVLPLDYTKNIDTFDIKMTHGLWNDSLRTVSLDDEECFQLTIDEFNFY